MGKAYGMIACTTLIAAGLWVANIGNSPAQAVAGVETPGTTSGYSTHRAATGAAPLAGYSSTTDRTVAAASIVRAQTPETPESQFGSDSGPVPFDSPEKRNAVQLLKSARRELAAGRFDIARKKAREAQQLNAKYAVFEDNPQLVLSEIDRRSGGIIFTPNQNQVVTAVADNSAPATIDPAGFDDSGASPKERALTLLRDARQDMRAGRFAAAREKALEAQGFNVAYGLFEDNPELLLEDLGRMATQTPVATPSAGSSDKQIAQNLVKEARQALYAGQYDQAYQKAVAAQQYEVTYNLLEDRPDAVLNELQTVMAGQSAKATNSIAAAPTPKPAAPTMPAAPTAPAAGPNDAKARELVKQARAALQAGQLDEAWAKATAAGQMNVAFQLFEDTPERIMSEIEQASATPKPTVAQAGATRPSNLTSSADTNPNVQAAQLVREARAALKNGQFETAKQKAMLADQLNATYGPVDDRPELVLSDLAAVQANPFGEPVAAARYPEATQSYPVTAANVTPVYPASMSAGDLYETGMTHMRNGNMNAAREAFLMAYRQEEQLEPRRRQQLQDFLRELAPRGNSPVELTSARNYDDSQTGQLDLVEQQRAMQYDRLRAEVMNSIFRAERLREQDPDQALAVLDQALANVENSDLAEDAAKNLVNHIRRTQTSVNSYKEQQAPLLELKQRNAEVKSAVEAKIARDIQIETEFAKLVDEFNKLKDERRYSEAEVIAKQAMELAPEFPEAQMMKLEAQYARRNAYNEDLKERKANGWLDQLDMVDESNVYELGRDVIVFPDAKKWKDLTDRRSDFGGPTNKVRTETEKKIEESLSRQISLHFDNAPLTEVMKHVANMMGITVYVDGPALAEVGVDSNTTISIDVDGIMLKSALNLILKPMELGYNIEDEVLKVTNRLRMQGKLVTFSYPVADLVVPLSNANPNNVVGQPYFPNFSTNASGGYVSNSGAGFNLGGVNGFYQVDDAGALPALGSPFPGGRGASDRQRTTQVNFSELSDLITTTVEPETWTEFNGSGSLMANESTLSLVIRQTQGVHDQIADLLEQLRRLQDLQVTIEVRFITVADEFFERIGVDFDFNVQDTIEGEQADLPPFGTPDSGATQGTNQGQNNQMTTNTFTPLNPALTPEDVWHKPSIVGLSDSGMNFTNDLDIGFRQGSFDLGVPEFVNTDPLAGASMGFAILSDIEAFFFINAAQGDSRSNIMFAPKVTLFNGQTAFVGDFVQRPFVTGFRPIVGVGAVGFEPIITLIPDGVTMSVAAVISADRRYVRLSVQPLFTTITDVQQFSVPGGSVGNFGGVNVGNQGTNQGANQGTNNTGSGQTFTLQQPITEIVTVQTTVSVPDGGTVLLGGVKKLQEGRNMAGVPILNKLPYVSRLFKNTGVGRRAESLMLMVTPRIIIQEEEEQLLGLPVQ